MKIRNLKPYLMWLALAFIMACSTDMELDNVFYCFNNCVRTLPNAPVGFEAQAALVKRLGYGGMAGHGEENYYELREAMDRVGLEMPEIYIPMNMVDGKASCHEALKNIMEHSADRGLLVALHLHAEEYMENKAEGDKLFVQGIRELADFAAPLNIDIAIYPHVNIYCETLEHALNLAEQAGRKNAGITLN